MTLQTTNTRPSNRAPSTSSADASSAVRPPDAAAAQPPSKQASRETPPTDQFTETKASSAATQESGVKRPSSDRSALRGKAAERAASRGTGTQSGETRSAQNAELTDFRGGAASAPVSSAAPVEAAKSAAAGGSTTLEAKDLPKGMQDALKAGAKEAGLDPKLVDNGQLKLKFDAHTGKTTIEASAGGQSKSVEIGGEKVVGLLNKGLEKCKGKDGTGPADHLEFTFTKADGNAPARIGLKGKNIDLDITKASVGVSYSIPDSIAFVQAMGDAAKSAKFDTAQHAMDSVQNVLNAQNKLNPRVEAELKDFGSLTIDVAPKDQVKPLENPIVMDKAQLSKLADKGAKEVGQMFDAARPALEPQLKSMGISWPADGNVKALIDKLPNDFKIEMAGKLNPNGSTTSDMRIGPVNGKTLTASGDVNTGGVVSLLWREYCPYLKLSTPPKDDPNTKNLKENEYVFAKLEKGDCSLTVGYNTKDAYDMIRAGMDMAKSGKKPTLEGAQDFLRKYQEANQPDYVQGTAKYKDVEAKFEVVRQPHSGEPPSSAKSGATLMPDLVREQLKNVGIDPDKAGDNVRFDMNTPSVKDGKAQLTGDVYVKGENGWEKLSVSASVDPGKGVGKFALQVAEKVFDAFKSGKVDGGKMLDTLKGLGKDATEFYKNLSAKDAIDLLKGAGNRFGEVAKTVFDNLPWEKAVDLFKDAPKELAQKMWGEISWDDASQLLQHASKDAIGKIWDKLSWSQVGDMLKNVPKDVFGKVWDAVGKDNISQAVKEGAERKGELVKAMWGKMSGTQKAALVATGVLNPVMLLAWGLSL